MCRQIHCTMVVIVLLWGGIANAQNLVRNPSLEAFTQCPSVENNVDGYVDDWMQGTFATSDYFNVCATTSSGCFTDVPLNFGGSQAAHTGNAYGGFFVYGTNPPHVVDQREYLEVPLTAPLLANKVYGIRFFVSLAEGSDWAIKEIGAYLSTTKVTGANALPSPGGAGTGPIPVVPQYEHSCSFLDDTTNWIQLDGSFTAAGGEEWLVIGNFRSNANTMAQARVGSASPCFGNLEVAYYYLDDVSLELDPLEDFCFPGQGTTISCPCSNQPVAPGKGCNNFGAGPIASGELSATGVADVSDDSSYINRVVLHATGENNTSLTIFLQSLSSSDTGLVFGAGVRCITGDLKRLYTGNAACGAISRPNTVAGGVNDIPVSVRGAIPAGVGGIRYYMCYYRDPQAAALTACNDPVKTFNCTNSGKITWVP